MDSSSGNLLSLLTEIIVGLFVETPAVMETNIRHSKPLQLKKETAFIIAWSYKSIQFIYKIGQCVTESMKSISKTNCSYREKESPKT